MCTIGRIHAITGHLFSKMFYTFFVENVRTLIINSNKKKRTLCCALCISNLSKRQIRQIAALLSLCSKYNGCECLSNSRTTVAIHSDRYHCGGTNSARFSPQNEENSIQLRHTPRKKSLNFKCLRVSIIPKKKVLTRN